MHHKVIGLSVFQWRGGVKALKNYFHKIGVTHFIDEHPCLGLNFKQKHCEPFIYEVAGIVEAVKPSENCYMIVVSTFLEK